MKYAFIKEHTRQYPVSMMCRVLRVSRSGFCAWLVRPRSRRSVEDDRLLECIRQVHRSSRRTYGVRRVYRSLRGAGEAVGQRRVARLMLAAGVSGLKKKRFVSTTNSRHTLPVAANVLERQFDVAAPNQVWAADITYVPTAEGWLYLAAVLDLHSRMVVGWSMGESLETGLTVRALEMAAARRGALCGLVAHSDRGVQYASLAYQDLLRSKGFVCSMSRKGNCWDNACAESFFATLKRDLIHNRRYSTRDEARRDIFDYIELFYNRTRLHSSLGYMSPAQFEQQTN